MDYELFEQEFEKLTGVCLNFYKEKQMKRRINTLIDRKGFSGYEEFMSVLKSDHAELAAFLDYITINVTEFFRHPDHWKYLETDVIPELLNNQKGPLKIWSTACATGEEPYSLAMSMLKMTDPSRFHIIATDIDDKVLRSAEEGLYRGKSIEKLPDDIIERFFEKRGDGLKISDEVRSCVEFRKMDLLKDPYPSDCDLIVCRNVLIYFTEEAKNRLYMQFKQSLKPEGWLFTGDTEQIIYYKKFGMLKYRNFIYRNGSGTGSSIYNI